MLHLRVLLMRPIHFQDKQSDVKKNMPGTSCCYCQVGTIVDIFNPIFCREVDRYYWTSKVVSEILFTWRIKLVVR